MKDTTRRRSLVLGTVIGTGALLLTACGGGGNGGGEDETAGPVDLRMVMWSSNEGHHEIFNAIADAYVEAHPELVSDVTFEPLASEDYVGALTTQIAGGDVPDLAWVTEGYARQFVDAGVFADLAPTFEETEDYDVDDVLPGALDLWTTDDGVYGYPFSNSPFGVYVNSDLLAAAGQPDPRELLASGEWTWERAMEIAAATAQSHGTAGFLTGASVDPYTQWNDSLGAIWLSWGAAPWSEDGTECTMSSPEMVDFFDWFHGQVFDTGAVPGPGEEYDFASGQAAFMLAQLSASTGLGDSFGWDFLPLPGGPVGTVPVVGQGGVGVLSQGRHPEIAADFLAFFTNPESSELLAQYFPPPRASLLDVDTLSAAAPALTAEQIQGTVIDQALDAVTKVGHPRMSEIVDPVRIDLDDLWVPSGDAQTVLDQVCESISPILAGS